MTIIQTRQIEVEYTDAELLQFGQELSRAEREAREIEEKKKTATAEFTSALKLVKASIYGLSLKLEYKRGPKNVECQIHFNKPTRGKKEIYRRDTGELVATEAMTAEEMQQRFEFEEPAAKADSFLARMQAAKDADVGRQILHELALAIQDLGAGIQVQTVGQMANGYRGFSVVQPKEWRATQKRIRDNGFGDLAKQHEALVEDGKAAHAVFTKLVAGENARYFARKADEETGHAEADGVQ